jgi:aryl-alcohol dehydrogenase-like predicted oxidoreductase
MIRTTLTPDYSISPVIKGGWQLSAGHSLTSTISEEQAIADIVTFIDAGITTLDFGDIYTGVELTIGKALKELAQRDGSSARERVQLHTKYVPNEKFLDQYDSADAKNIVYRSLDRLGVDQVDLVQFHWWRYEAKNYLKALEQLFLLKASHHIREVGITNFDLARIQEMVAAGLKPASLQLQYSILDRRAESDLVDYCILEGIGLLCYGTVAGGFLSERYLGVPEPREFDTRSNVKYQLIIEDFGGWELFQELLQCLGEIAQSHQTDIATISSAYTLGRPGVTGVIVGARNVDHLESNLRIPTIRFNDEELAKIAEILAASTGPNGPVYHLERYDQRHSGIMHTNNN